MNILIRIEGVSPLILNKFYDEAALRATSGASPSNGGDRGSPREQAEKKLYVNEEGEAIIPSPNLLRSIMDGGSFHKIGKKQVTTKRESILCSCVEINELAIKIQSLEGWSVDTRPVVIPATQGRILMHRPIFQDWALEFDCKLDTTLVPQKLFRQIVDDAGRRIGIGDFRPARKGPYGRYCVTGWREA